ncbi:LexA family transcriptional regulator [uncultured Megasphaera sp.]|jgi:repressor LexA|uniref:LexA family protein n=1 Tax=uncultured Megasphaera sp. TaxID=165188 RepID=UPI002590E45F|nr:XRE family transcriptional regulator [uncultured Megasphaera sp.]
MSTLGSRIKELRLERKMTGDELGRVLGISKSTISLYEHDKSTPDDAIKKKICSYFDVSFDWLMGITTSRTTIYPKRTGRGVPIPVLGRVVAGIPLEAVEEILDYEEITPELAATGEFFALQVKGDSMLPKLEEGDVVIVKKQGDVETGDIAIVLVNGDEATIKQVKKVNGGIMLYGFNPDVYEPHFYSNQQIEELPVRILGKVIESRRSW